MDRSSLEKELKLVISRELKRLRKQDDCSLERMAEKVGLEYSSLYNIYSGRNLPQLTTLIQISQTYNIPIDFWFKSIKQLVARKREKLSRSAEEQAILRVFNKIDKDTGAVILRVLQGYARRPKYEAG